VSEPILPSRRPSRGRLIGFALLLTAVSWGLGAFAAFPWRGSDPEAAMLRVAFKHVAAFEQRGSFRSKEELEKLPRHMRPTSPELAGTGRRVSTVLRLEVDGQLSLEKSYTPGGLRHDGPTFGYEELAVAPGRHRLRVTLADGRAPGRPEEAARQWQLGQELDLRRGQALLIEFSEASGLTIRSPELVHRPVD
jgi:hypothetical protein